MKTIAALLALLALPLFAADTKKAPAKKTVTAKAAEPLTIPKDAVQNANGSYSYTDKSGKRWVFNNTPFGISRIEDVGPAVEKEPIKEAVTGIESGDSVKFTRKTPFGDMKWEKKKTELNDEERAVLAKQQAAAPGKQ